MMPEFKITADFVFDADDIVNALEILTTHFKTLSDGNESDIIKLGKITIDKIGDNKNV